LEKAGFPPAPPEFRIEIAPEKLGSANITEPDAGNYFHISPFTTADYKELSPVQMAEFISVLIKDFPEKKIALSCAPTAREQNKMTELLALLPQKPWRVFAGNLDLVQLAAVIKNSALHFCGDTGTLHLAAMTNTPTVTWFWPNPGLRHWAPVGEKHRFIVGVNEADSPFLRRIVTDELICAAQSVLAGDPHNA
jgi:ADP-heptose:LPS heptosyltransferase